MDAVLKNEDMYAEHGLWSADKHLWSCVGGFQSTPAATGSATHRLSRTLCRGCVCILCDFILIYSHSHQCICKSPCRVGLPGFSRQMLLIVLRACLTCGDCHGLQRLLMCVIRRRLPAQGFALACRGVITPTAHGDIQTNVQFPPSAGAASPVPSPSPSPSPVLVSDRRWRRD